MNDEQVPREPSRRSGPRGRRFKRHELELPDGGALVLGNDGTIDHVDALGATTRSWPTTDPEWPDQAIRFGLRVQAPTVTPQGRRVPGTKPPRQ
jgi:hypothetical protein